MPRSAAALWTERAYADALADIRRRISVELASLTLDLDLEDVADAIAAFAPLAARMIAGGQVEAQQAAASFVADYLEAEGASARPRSIAADVAGTNEDGEPLTSLVGGSLANGILTMLRSGHPTGEALRFAAHSLSRLASSEVAAAADREVAHQGEDRRRVEGWVWVLTGAENCAACLSRADGRLRSMDEPFPRHPHCDCIRSIRLTGDPGTVEHPIGEELFRRMSPEQQARQFRTAGETKAELVRSGQVALADLVAVERHDSWRTIVTERPLAEVAP